MNKEHLDQIIKHYIREFEKINGMGEEYYKWQKTPQQAAGLDSGMHGLS